MTRFDAATPDERRTLFAEAVEAHRGRGSQFLTVETPETDAEEHAPWVQLAGETLNMDVTDAELERLKTLLEAYPEFSIERLESPGDAEGTNVRIAARSDADRVAGFLERVFREVYGRGEGYRGWVTKV